MPYGNSEYAKCPRCGKIALGEGEIERHFGYRTMESGKVIPQSHCREGRSEEARNSR